MKVIQKKLDDGVVLLEATASTSEVSSVLHTAQLNFCQQMGVRPLPGKSMEECAQEQMGTCAKCVCRLNRRGWRTAV